MGSTERKILLTVLKASGIPSRTIHRSSKLSVEVSAGEHIWKTKECQGNNPEWSEAFVLNIQDSAVLHVAVIDRVGTGRSSLRGETSVAIKDIGGIAVVEKTFQLQKDGRSRGKITLTFEQIPLRESAPISSQDAGVDVSAGESSLSAVETSRRSPHEIPVVAAEPVSQGTIVDASGNLPPSSAVERPANSPEEVTVAVDEAHRSVSGLTTPRVIGSMPSITGDVNAVEGVTGSPGFALVFGYVEKLVNIGGVLAEVHPWAALAWSVLSVIPKTIGAQMDRDQKVQQLWSTTADMLSFLQDAEPVIEQCQVHIVSEMMKQIYDCALFVREYCGKGFAKRALRDSMSSSTDSAIEQYNAAFKELKEQFKSRSELIALRIFKDIRQGIVELSSLSQGIKDLERTMLLENLPGSDLAGVRCDINRICLPTTRQGLLADIMAWVADPSGKQAFWLHGVAGTGKSTVANTVAARFAKVGRLGASFRFSRDVDGRNGPAFLFGSVAYQLASFSRVLKGHIHDAVETHGKMTQFSPREQLQKYIIEPMSQVAFTGPIVIVLDALDECGGERDRHDILGAIKDEMANFPPFVKLFLVSRYEVDIRSHLERGCLSKSIDGIDGTARDILDYIAVQMLEVADRHALPSDWLAPETKAELGGRADGLFIWASVACDFILRSDDPKVALHYMVSTETLHSTGEGDALDALYTGILQQASTSLPSSLRASNLRNIIGAIVTAKTPLTQQGLDMLLGLNVRVLQHPILLPDDSRLELTTCSSVIARLGSMLRKEDGFIRVLHASIFDFFTSPTRCTDSRFYIDKGLFSRFLASRCFDAMRVLKRDMCGINDPTKMNRDIYDLSQRLQDNVPEHVRYGCLYWHLHLADIAIKDRELIQEAKNWLSTHLLHWFEVMSLWGDAGGILIALDRIIPWFQSHLQSDEVLLLLKDADCFVRRFYGTIRCNAAHIYTSAIPFTPRHSSIFKLFAPMLKQIPKMLTNLPGSPSPLITLPLPVYRGEKSFFPAISPDGSCFTYVHDDMTLQLWDLNTCTPTDPLIGHRTSICHTCFSDDGTKVASVDLDGVIFVWDTVEYRAVGGPFQCHTHSPDASKISLVDDHVVLLRGGAMMMYVDVWSYLTGELVVSYRVRGALLCGRYILTRTWTRTRRTETYSILDALTGIDNTPAYARSIGILQALFPAHSQVRRVACRLLVGEFAMFSTETGDLIGTPIPKLLHAQLSPCGQWLAATVQTDINPNARRPMLVIDIYSACTGERLMSRQSQRSFGSAFWSIDSLLFLPMSHLEATLDIWNMETMTHTATLRFPTHRTIFFGASRHRIMLQSHGSRTISVTVWDIASLAKPIEQQSPSMKDFELSPTGGHSLITTSDSIINTKHPVSFSPDGSFVATASSGDDLLVWNLCTGKLSQRLCGAGRRTVSLSISPNNTRVVAASDDGSVHLWDVASGRKLCTTQTAVVTRPVRYLYLCADGRNIAYRSNEDGVGMVDITTSQSRTCDLPDNHWRWAELSSNAAQITCVSESGNIGLRDGVTGEVIKTLASNVNGSVVKVVWSPIKDSFVAIRHINIIQILGQYESSLVCPMALGLLRDNNITELVFSNDGMWLAALSPYTIHPRDMRRRCLAWTKEATEGSPHLVAFVGSGVGCRVLMFSNPFYSLKLFKANTGSLLWWTCHGSGIGTVERVVMSSDEAQAVFFVESIGGVAVELSTGGRTPFSSELRTCRLRHLFVSCVSRTSAWIWGLVGDDLVMICSGGHSNVDVLKSAACLGGHTKVLLIRESSVQLWDASASPSLRNVVRAMTYPPPDALLSPDGSRLLFDNGLYLVDTAPSLTQIHKGLHLQWNHNAIFSSDSHYVARWGFNHKENTPSVEITDVSDGSCICRLTSPYYQAHTGSILLSPDCRRFAALFSNGDIRVWHLGDLPHVTQGRLVSNSSFPRSSIYPLYGQSCIGRDGWLIGEDGQRLLWIPDEMRTVKLLTARRHGRLVLECARDEAMTPIVLDMSDYLTVPQVARGWKEGGVQICDSDAEVQFRRAVVYMGDTPTAPKYI
ncbi:hypothetical protein BV22DRAFT_813037 [Leucogyrophana mollusca]|uniref:Uncharacterized protein n=1 Tax=Leucogyrophana mollusca TaxID=85980 RepID=A0ACB8B425_9AGAM|nr:hypothetical protein BV22DRAFT_813037 [Leucogyrophana mollusca]